MHASPADHAACRALLRGGSRSFHAAARLLPHRVAGPATALFAFCRVADDAIDLRRERSEVLRLRLDRAYEGRPMDHPADRALADLVAAHALPRGLPRALVEGFAWDEAGTRYDTLDALLDYAARVAGTVGAMMAWLMGSRAAAPLARACELGIAMQLTNIARDVGEDARAGRLYLPLDWLRDEGVDVDAWLAAPAPLPGVRVATRRLLDVASGLYERADAGVAALPWDCRVGIGAARRLYAAIGDEVIRADGDSVTGRAVVPCWRKARLVARAVAAPRASWSRAPALPCVAFLIEACAMPERAVAPARMAAAGRMAWLVELFLRLDQRARAESPA